MAGTHGRYRPLPRSAGITPHLPTGSPL